MSRVDVSTVASEIQFECLDGPEGSIGLITLTRPKALNALTQWMCIALHEQLDIWREDDRIKAVVIRGEGEKAFCAGGDVRSLYDNGPDAAEDSAAFFWHEYRMNAAIYHFPKPYIALMDGITMGGGCGVSMHGRFRVATERLMLAMPETGIGLFPDVGGGYFLSRCPQHTGMYLGLTGERIHCADALFTGFATHAVESQKIAAWLEQLVQQSWSNDAFADVEKSLQAFSYAPGTAPLQAYAAWIEAKFAKDSVQEILASLESCDQDDCQAWCEKTAATIKAKSPTSVLVTFLQLQRARSLSFDASMKMEFRLACHFMKSHDFYEGVRAALVDKDRSPQWQPSELSAVANEDVLAYFEQTFAELDLS